MKRVSSQEHSRWLVIRERLNSGIRHTNSPPLNPRVPPPSPLQPSPLQPSPPPHLPEIPLHQWLEQSKKQSSVHSTGRQIFIKELRSQTIEGLEDYFSNEDPGDGTCNQSPRTRSATESTMVDGSPIEFVTHSPSNLLSSVAERVSLDLGGACVPPELDLEAVSLFYVYWRALFQKTKLYSTERVKERLEYLSAVTARTLMSRQAGLRRETTADPPALPTSDQAAQRMLRGQLPADDQSFLFWNNDYLCLVSRLKRFITTTSTGDISSGTRLHLTSCLSASGTILLCLNWDPIRFLNEQYGVGHDQTLADCICILGTPVDAYASTCLEYMQLISPSIGTATLRLLDEWVAQANLNPSTGTSSVCSALVSLNTTLGRFFSPCAQHQLINIAKVLKLF